MAIELNQDEQQQLEVYTEQAYLDYAMYVILDRALPHIGDGLKPVQRRILYAMSELNLSHQAKYKKSARTIGDVLGKFHPHSDTACYEAMVLMAQPFAYRYPFIDGQGNWGAADDPKSFAAMRYTEARLSAFAQLLLKEVGQGTVDWIDNFDATLKEPKILPAQVPAILLNGTTGIAVGMATDIPPHNLTEVINACVEILDNPSATLSDISKHIKGPDYPTDAEIITPKSEIKDIYKTGLGTIRMRAKYKKEKEVIVVNGLPHMTSGAKVLEQIATKMQKKQLPMVVDLRDESDHENPTRLVIVPRSNRVDVDELMNHLFATTDLERTYRVNLNMIGLDGRPKVFNLIEILNSWLTFRTDCVKLRLQHRLNIVIDRLHILESFLTAFLNIDEVIKIIREQDKPKPILIKRFQLTAIQADAILDLKLRHLAKLEEQKIQAEQDKLSKERKMLEQTLGSDKRLKTLIKDELTTIRDEIGDKRRTRIVVREEAKVLDMVAKQPSEPMTVVLSKNGWIRAGKGHELDGTSLNYKSGDSYHTHVLAMSNEPTVFFDSNGRAYTILTSSMPSVRGYGEPLTGRIQAESGVSFDAAIAKTTDKYLLVNSAGYGFSITFEELLGKNKTGKAIMNMVKEAKLLPPLAVNAEATHVVMVTEQARLLITPIAAVPVMSKGKGRKLINVPSQAFSNQEDTLVAVGLLNMKQTLTVIAGRKKAMLKGKDLKHYQGELGDRGMRLPKGIATIKGLLVEDK